MALAGRGIGGKSRSRVFARPWVARLHAWWEGYEYRPPAAPGGALEPGDKGAPGRGFALPAGDEGRRARLWNDPRYLVAERIWGTGFLGPGGPEQALDFVKPLGLTPKMSALDLGARLGGNARAVATGTGAWVTGLEDSPLLTEAGMELSRLAGLAKKAPVVGYEPANPRLKPRGFNAAYSREALFLIPDRESLFLALYQALRGKGQLLFSDYMVTRRQTSAAEAWAANEPVAPSPWGVDEARTMLAGLGFEVRVTEDISAEFRRLAGAAFQRFRGELDTAGLDEPVAGALAAETALWAGRIEALESGAVAVYRVYARKSG